MANLTATFSVTPTGDVYSAASFNSNPADVCTGLDGCYELEFAQIHRPGPYFYDGYRYLVGGVDGFASQEENYGYVTVMKSSDGIEWENVIPVPELVSGGQQGWEAAVQRDGNTLHILYLDSSSNLRIRTFDLETESWEAPTVAGPTATSTGFFEPNNSYHYDFVVRADGTYLVFYGITGSWLRAVTCDPDSSPQWGTPIDVLSGDSAGFHQGVTVVGLDSDGTAHFLGSKFTDGWRYNTVDASDTPGTYETDPISLSDLISTDQPPYYGILQDGVVLSGYNKKDGAATDYADVIVLIRNPDTSPTWDELDTGGECDRDFELSSIIETGSDFFVCWSTQWDTTNNLRGDVYRRKGNKVTGWLSEAERLLYMYKSAKVVQGAQFQSKLGLIVTQFRDVRFPRYYEVLEGIAGGIVRVEGSLIIRAA